MDYKEKYTKAFERARKLYNDPNITIGQKGNLEDLFPELQQSEDERIRKEIIGFIKSKIENSCSPTPSKNKLTNWITWLEKQSEYIQQTPQWMIDFLDVNRMKFACSIEDGYDEMKEAEGKILAISAWLTNHGNQFFNIQWHSIDEEPEDKREIFCEWEGSDTTWHDVAFYHADTKEFWCVGRKLEGFVKWAYIDEMLEQGKQKGYTFKSLPRLLDMIEPTSKAKEYCQKLIDTLEKEGYTSDAKIVGELLKTKNGEEVPMATMDEIQVDNANKVEPKFKVGDWIIRSAEGFKHDIYLVTDVKDYYVCEALSGERFTLTINDVHKHFTLWTIQDAKDGDVLAEDGKPFIFKGLLDTKHPDCPVAYCGIEWKNNFIVGSGLGGGTSWWCSCKRVKPATNGQSHLLFEKMAEAEYEWDSDKKVLNPTR